MKGKRARKIKVALRVVRRMRIGQKRKGKNVRAMQKSICQRTQDYGQRSSLINRETQLFARWLIKVQKKTETTKMAPKDMERKPFPNYYQYAKSANGCEKIRRDYYL